MRERVDSVFDDGRVQRAFRYISSHEPEIQADQIRFTQVAAPPFGEAERSHHFAGELGKLGFQPVSDSIGNVIAPYEATGLHPVVVGAHLDTVFPASTPLQFRQKGRALLLPGISDNGAGIVALLWALRAAKENGIRFGRPVIAVGNVGEEGEGNLRGIRHLFNRPPWEGNECEFIAVDGSGLQRITHRALGSRRFRIRMTGPGGHSWADFGGPNPVHAMSTVIHSFCAADVYRTGCSFNFGVFRGGISVNAIPSEATADVDLRSTADANLQDLESQLRQIVGETMQTAHVNCTIELLGDRPSGTTPLGTAIVQAAVEVTRRFGVEPQLDIGSTDANIPISLGLAAIAVGGGGISGNVHTPDEWFDPLHRYQGIQRLLALIAVLAGL